MKPKLAALRREVAKLLTGAPASGQGRGWFGVWTWNDWVETLVPAFASKYPRVLCSAMAAEYIAQRAAEHLGITSMPEYVAVQNELADAIAATMSAPSPGCDWHKPQWQEHYAVEDRLHSAYARVGDLVLQALGFPGGILGPRPPENYEPGEWPEWLLPPAVPPVTEAAT